MSVSKFNELNSTGLQESLKNIQVDLKAELDGIWQLTLHHWTSLFCLIRCLLLPWDIFVCRPCLEPLWWCKAFHKEYSQSFDSRLSSSSHWIQQCAAVITRVKLVTRPVNYFKADEDGFQIITARSAERCSTFQQAVVWPQAKLGGNKAACPCKFLSNLDWNGRTGAELIWSSEKWKSMNSAP